MKGRYPLQPLLDAFGTVNTRAGARNMEVDCTTAALAEMMGVSPRAIHRWRAEGLSELTADRAAVTLGLHPASIWPEWWENAVREAA